MKIWRKSSYRKRGYSKILLVAAGR